MGNEAAGTRREGVTDMEGKVLYLHGLGSDGSSRTACMLKDALGEGRVVAPDFDMHDPEEALRQAKEAIAADPSISLAVGTSMGGFVALCLQQIPRIAINPCTRPSAILGDDAKGIERWLWEWAFDLESASDVRLAVFGGKDAVCPWAYDDYESAGGMRAMLLHDEGHSLSDEAIMNVLIPAVAEALGVQWHGRLHATNGKAHRAE